jgi:translation initiation factor 2 beta subunit (eIF-2beta)/eIF-5
MVKAVRMKLATKGLIFKGLNVGETVDFSKVETVEQLKVTIANNYVVLCRNCASEGFCRFHDSSEPPCPILERVVDNYIDMNIRSVDTENQFALSGFIKSVILLIRIFNYFENWRGIYVDEHFNWYFESVHPRLNSFYAFELLVEISQYVKAYRVVQTKRVKRFVIFVEGDSESVALPPIFKALGVAGIDNGIANSVRFINLEGKDRVQRDKIKTNLEKFKENEISYFLILDNDSSVANYIEDLQRAGLMEDNHSLVWQEKFEDNFGEEVILRTLRQEANEVFDKIDLEKLKRCNATKHDVGKSIEYLMKEKGTPVNFDDYKVSIAKRISEVVCQEIEESMTTESGVYDGRRTPKSKSFPEFVEKLRKIAEEIKKISSEYHVIKRKRASSDE